MTKVTIENFLPRQINEQMPFLVRAAVCANLLLTKPDLIVDNGEWINQFTIKSSVEERDEVPEGFVQYTEVYGNCFEFLEVLFDCFLTSVRPVHSEEYSQEEFEMRVKHIRALFSYEQSKPHDSRYLLYCFRINSSGEAEIELQFFTYTVSLTDLVWIPARGH